MARVLFAWELGWQLGHLSNVASIARRLARDGHEIAVAARELQHAHAFFRGVRVQYYQAPFKQGSGPELRRYLSYAHLLHASGFADPRELTVLLSAWMGILGSFRPEIVVFDHAPSALLAGRALDARRVLIGSGFLVPPEGEPPLGVFPGTPRTPESLEALKRDDETVLGVVNEAARPFGIGPLDRLGELYEVANARCLLTFPELDPFGERPPSSYYGVWPIPGLGPPEWPAGRERRVFAYLTNFPGCRALLDALKSTGAGVLVHGPAVPAEIRCDVEGDGLCFTEELLDLDEVGASCDLFVSHGAHSSVARMLLNGVPQLMVPNYREQLFTAEKVKRLGAGLVSERDRSGYAEALEEVLEERAYRDAARAFARRHAGFDAEESATKLAAALF